jgi:hypothetical protein
VTEPKVPNPVLDKIANLKAPTNKIKHNKLSDCLDIGEIIFHIYRSYYNPCIRLLRRPLILNGAHNKNMPLRQ